MTKVSDKTIKNLRETFFTLNEGSYEFQFRFGLCKYYFFLKENIKDFHNEDLKRLKENDEWIKAFYSKSGKLKWRQDFGVNSINI